MIYYLFLKTKFRRFSAYLSPFSFHLLCDHDSNYLWSLSYQTRSFLSQEGSRKLAVNGRCYNQQTARPQKLQKQNLAQSKLFYHHQKPNITGDYPYKTKYAQPPHLKLLAGKVRALYTSTPSPIANDSTSRHRQHPHNLRTRHDTPTPLRLRRDPHTNNPQRRRSNPPLPSSQLAHHPRIITQKRRLGNFWPRSSISPRPTRLPHQRRPSRRTWSVHAPSLVLRMGESRRQG